VLNFLRAADQQVALTGHAAVQRGDRARRDVLARHPRNRKSEIALDLSAIPASSTRLKAGAVQGAFDDRGRTEDRAGVTHQHVVARCSPPGVLLKTRRAW